MAQAIAYMNGFETGDGSQLVAIGTGGSVQTATVRTGAYAFKAGTGNSQLGVALASTQTVVRFYFRLPTLPGAATSFLVERVTGSATNRLRLRFNATNKLEVSDAAATLGLTTTAGTATINVNTWYRIELFLDLAAGGVVKVLVDGATDINVTHTNNVSATTTQSFLMSGVASPNEYIFDDIRIDTGGVAAVGAGQHIARQGLTGTPTYDAWTENGAATAALCWSDTPFATGTNATSSTSGDAQTMLVAQFTQRQTGHGLEVIGSTDTINGCKVGLIAKDAVGAVTPSIRRRLSGANTDTAFTVTTLDAFYEDAIWTTSAINLDSLEAGIVHAADTNLETVEDVWVMVDYTPATADTLAAQIVM